MRLLYRLGLEDDIVEMDMLAGEARLSIGPELEERLDIFVGDLAALSEIRRLDGLEFLLQPTGADAERQASARQNVDGRQHLGRQYRGAMRHHHHRGDEPQPRRLGGQESHFDELFVPFGARASREFTCRAVGIFGLDVGRDHDMVAERGVVEAHGFAFHDQFRQRCGRR